MEDEAKWLQHRRDQYWRLLAGVVDERAVQAIQQMIAELEERLKRLAPNPGWPEGVAAPAADGPTTGAALTRSSAGPR